MMKAAFKFLFMTGLWQLLVSVGILLSRFLPARNESRLFFFFPSYHIGGAEKVHADIVSVFADLRPWVIFTRRSVNGNYKTLFAKSARLFDLWYLALCYPISVGLAAGIVNRHRDAIVFGCNNPFYYYLVPQLQTHVRKLDLTHAFDGLERLSLKVSKELDARIVINRKTAEDFSEQYRANGIDSSFLDRIMLIENQVMVPTHYPKTLSNGPLRVIYVGRGTVEKRVHLVGRAASRLSRNATPAEFTMVGRGIAEAVAVEDRPLCRFLGEIVEPTELQRHYADADVLVLTSSREGFPLVIMEAMANGVVPISTAVGGIPVHVKHGSNGFLVDKQEEDAIVEELASWLMKLHSDRDQLALLSRNAYEYARHHFSSETFSVAYRSALLGSPINSKLGQSAT